MQKKERVSGVIDKFKELYPNVKCSLTYETPLQMLLATQLSAQCTDAKVNTVTPALFARYKTAEDFANADLEELQQIIRSIGLYRNKAKNIIACCRRIADEYGGEVPDNMDDLLTLAGTGRKTANLVLGDIFGKPAVVVDTHCIRLTNRIGLVNTDDPVKIENEMKKIVPPEEQLRLCHCFVYHGRAVCPARKPRCEDCGIRTWCKSAGKV